MIIRRFKSNPRRAAAVMMAIGMFCLVLASVWTRVVAHSPALNAQWTDFATGLAYGLSIGANLVSVILLARH